MSSDAGGPTSVQVHRPGDVIMTSLSRPSGFAYVLVHYPRLERTNPVIVIDDSGDECLILMSDGSPVLLNPLYLGDER